MLLSLLVVSIFASLVGGEYDGSLSAGCLDDDTKPEFVKEVERVGRDPVHWVRREASFALGALAKVVPEGTVLNSLVIYFFSSCRCLC